MAAVGYATMSSTGPYHGMGLMVSEEGGQTGSARARGGRGASVVGPERDELIGQEN